MAFPVTAAAPSRTCIRVSDKQIVICAGLLVPALGGEQEVCHH